MDSEELEEEMLVSYDCISYSLILRGGPYSYCNRIPKLQKVKAKASL